MTILVIHIISTMITTSSTTIITMIIVKLQAGCCRGLSVWDGVEARERRDACCWSSQTDRDVDRQQWLGLLLGRGLLPLTRPCCFFSSFLAFLKGFCACNCSSSLSCPGCIAFAYATAFGNVPFSCPGSISVPMCKSFMTGKLVHCKNLRKLLMWARSTAVMCWTELVSHALSCSSCLLSWCLYAAACGCG